MLYEAEDATFDSTSGVDNNNPPFSGDGFINMGGQDSWIEWNNVYAGSGGICTLSFRYANGATSFRVCSVTVNGQEEGELQFAPTGGWANWVEFETILVPCDSGSNTIRITATTSSG